MLSYLVALLWKVGQWICVSCHHKQSMGLLLWRVHRQLLLWSWSERISVIGLSRHSLILINSYFNWCNMLRYISTRIYWVFTNSLPSLSDFYFLPGSSIHQSLFSKKHCLLEMRLINERRVNSIKLIKRQSKMLSIADEICTIISSPQSNFYITYIVISHYTC